MKQNIIALSGMRGSGKSTIGKSMAKLLGWKFLDLDQEIEARSKKTINQIIEESSWEEFRKIENETLKNIIKEIEDNQEKSILSLGGGCIINDENFELLKNKAFIIFIQCELKNLYKRIINCNSRPRLTPEKNLELEIEKIWEERKEKYLKRCHYSIDSSIDMNSLKLEKMLHQHLINLI